MDLNTIKNERMKKQHFVDDFTALTLGQKMTHNAVSAEVFNNIDSGKYAGIIANAKSKIAEYDTEIAAMELNEAAAAFKPVAGITGMNGDSVNGRNVIDPKFVRENYVVKNGKLYHKTLDRCVEWEMPIHGGADTNKLHVTIDKKYYNAHRLIYVWHTGEDITDVDITHLDGDSMNNDINNLAIREVA